MCAVFKAFTSLQWLLSVKQLTEHHCYISELCLKSLSAEKCQSRKDLCKAVRSVVVKLAADGT